MSRENRGFQLGANREQTYEAPIKSLWPASTLTLFVETWYADIEIILKQTRAFNGSNPPCPRWCDSSYRYFTLLYRINAPRLATIQRMVQVFCETRQSSAIGGERGPWIICMCPCDHIGQWYPTAPCVAPVSAETLTLCSSAPFSSSWRQGANIWLLFVLLSSSPMHLLRESVNLKLLNNI